VVSYNNQSLPIIPLPSFLSLLSSIPFSQSPKPTLTTSSPPPSI